MSHQEKHSWIYPKSMGDPGRDRNARTVQFACLLLAAAVSIVAVLNIGSNDSPATKVALFSAVGTLLIAALTNRIGQAKWAARIALVAMLMTAIALIVEARDGFRSHAMLLFPGILLVSLMLLDRSSYLLTAGIVLVTVAILGTADKEGFTRAIPGVRTPTSYQSIFFVDLNLLVIALIGNRIARDAQSNASDLSGSLKQLAASEDKFASAFRSGPAAMSIVDSEDGNRIVDINQRFEEATGYSRSDLVGRRALELGIWTEPPEYARLQNRFFADGRVRDFEFHFRRTDGETGVGLVSAEPIEVNNRRCAITCSIDITERKRAEDALRESEERFRKVFEEGPIGMGLVGKDYRFFKVNTAFCRMVGYPEAELVQKSFADITYSEDLQADVALAERLFTGELPHYQLQKRYIKKSGEIIWINLTASLIHDREGEPLYGLAMIEDVTELKRSQEEAFARQKLESVGLLASGIAHDFNNLLGSIRAQAELAAIQLAAGESGFESLQTITNVTNRGAEIVRELMIYAGLEAAGPAEPINLSSLLDEMIELFRVSIPKHVVLKTDLSDDIPPVLGKASQVRQIVMNLIINASEAIGDKCGAITIAASRAILPLDRTPADQARLPPGEYLKIEVSDTGVGMSEELQAKVFDPFFSTKFAGRGLGLAVVQSLVRDLRGSIYVTSALGSGSTFQIFLPRAPGTDGSPRQTISETKRVRSAL